MPTPARKKPLHGFDDPLPSIKPRKAAPHEFVLDALAELSPRTNPMFGCLAVYVEEKISAENPQLRPFPRGTSS